MHLQLSIRRIMAIFPPRCYINVLVWGIKSMKIQTLAWNLYRTHFQSLAVCIHLHVMQCVSCLCLCMCEQELVFSERKRNQLRGNSNQVKHDPFLQRRMSCQLSGYNLFISVSGVPCGDGGWRSADL